MAWIEIESELAKPIKNIYRRQSLAICLHIQVFSVINSTGHLPPQYIVYCTFLLSYYSYHTDANGTRHSVGA